MKRITSLAILATAALAFTFTACNDKTTEAIQDKADKAKETVETKTEEAKA